MIKSASEIDDALSQILQDFSLPSAEDAGDDGQGQLYAIKREMKSMFENSRIKLFSACVSAGAASAADTTIKDDASNYQQSETTGMMISMNTTSCTGSTYPLVLSSWWSLFSPFADVHADADYERHHVMFDKVCYVDVIIMQQLTPRSDDLLESECAFLESIDVKLVSKRLKEQADVHLTRAFEQQKDDKTAKNDSTKTKETSKKLKNHGADNVCNMMHVSFSFTGYYAKQTVIILHTTVHQNTTVQEVSTTLPQLFVIC